MKSTMIEEHVEHILVHLEKEFRMPRDSFYEPIPGTETDGEISWRLELKVNPQFFFWFRLTKQAPYLDCKPRPKELLHMFGERGMTPVKLNGSFVSGLNQYAGNWVSSIREKFHPLQVDIDYEVNYPETITEVDKLVFIEMLVEAGYNPFQDFIIYEQKPKEVGYEDYPWLMIRRADSNQFFRCKISADKIPIHQVPGVGTAPESNNVVHHNFGSSGEYVPLSGTSVYPPNVSRFKEWIERIKSTDKAKEKINNLKNRKPSNDIPPSPVQGAWIIDDDGFTPFEDVTNEETDKNVSPFSKDEVKQLREFIREWNQQVQIDESISEEEKEEFDNVASKVDFEISQNKTAPKSKVGGIIQKGFAEFMKAGRTELFKLAFNKALHKVPALIQWIQEWYKGIGG